VEERHQGGSDASYVTDRHVRFAHSGWFRCFLCDGQACKVWSLDGGGGLATAGLSG